MARLTALLALAALTLAGCAAAPDEAPPTVTETTTATSTPELTQTRDEAAYLVELQAHDKWDSETKLAIGHRLCDDLEGGTPLDQISVEEYVDVEDDYALASDLGLAVRALCPDAIPDAA